MKTLVEVLRDNWAGLTAAPWAFLLLVVVAFAAAFLVARWRYEAIVGILNERITLLTERLAAKDSQLDDYRERLHLLPASGTAFSRMSSSELQRKALAVVADIRHFLRERRARDPSLTLRRVARGGDVSEEQRQRDWEAETEALMRNSFDTAAEFDTRFKVDAILLRDELLSRLPAGAKNEGEFRTYEHPTNPIGMGMVADDLERLAKSLPVEGRAAGA